MAFLTEGDPSLYSTFIYSQDEARIRWPQVRIEVIPGDLRAVGAERGDCFAMVLVSPKERSGLLASTVPLREFAG